MTIPDGEPALQAIREAADDELYRQLLVTEKENDYKQLLPQLEGEEIQVIGSIDPDRPLNTQIGFSGAVADVYIIPGGRVLKLDAVFIDDGRLISATDWIHAEQSALPMDRLDEHYSRRFQRNRAIHHRLSKAGFNLPALYSHRTIPGLAYDYDQLDDEAEQDLESIASGRIAEEIKIEAPIYAEEWERIEGQELEDDPNIVIDMYLANNGQGELINFAQSLLKAATDGITVDVGRPSGFKNCVVQKTPSGYPFPANTILAGDKLFLFDINDSIDFTTSKHWKPEDQLVKFYPGSGTYGLNYDVFEKMKRGIEEDYGSVVRQFAESHTGINARADKLFMQARAEKSKLILGLDRLQTQVSLALGIIERIYPKEINHNYEDVPRDKWIQACFYSDESFYDTEIVNKLRLSAAQEGYTPTLKDYILGANNDEVGRNNRFWSYIQYAAQSQLLFLLQANSPQLAQEFGRFFDETIRTSVKSNIQDREQIIDSSLQIIIGNEELDTDITFESREISALDSDDFFKLSGRINVEVYAAFVNKLLQSKLELPINNVNDPEYQALVAYLSTALTNEYCDLHRKNIATVRVVQVVDEAIRKPRFDSVTLRTGLRMRDIEDAVNYVAEKHREGYQWQDMTTLLEGFVEQRYANPESLSIFQTFTHNPNTLLPTTLTNAA